MIRGQLVVRLLYMYNIVVIAMIRLMVGLPIFFLSFPIYFYLDMFVIFRKDHVTQENITSKQWNNNWSFMTTDYKEVSFLQNIQKHFDGHY